MGISKRMKSLTDSVDRDKLYSVDDGIALVKDTAKAKFDESVDASVNLGIDAKNLINQLGVQLFFRTVQERQLVLLYLLRETQQKLQKRLAQI